MLYESWINFFEILCFFVQLMFLIKENMFIYVRISFLIMGKFFLNF